MVRALAVLTCGAFLTLVIGVVGAGKPVLTVVLGGLYTVLATVGFAWVHRRDQRAWSVAYVAAVLALAGVVFALDPGAGSTLFLVCAGQPERAAAAAAGRRRGHRCRAPGARGMAWRDGLREGLGTLAAAVFTAVVTELLRREQQARASWPWPTSSCATTPPRPSSWPPRRSATGSPATSTTGSGTT